MTTKTPGKKEYGAAGEQAAANYLRHKGYNVLEMNFRAEGCEIDIIAMQKNVLVFTEVKTRRNNRYGEPEEAVNETKQQNLSRAAEAYIEKNNWKNEVRFDVISVIPQPQGTFKIYHICDAFSP